MLTIIILSLFVLALFILFILDKKNKIKKESKLRKLLEYLLLGPLILILILLNIYNNTKDFKDLCIAFLCFLVAGIGIGLYTVSIKKLNWPKFLLPVIVLALYEMILLLNHHLLRGAEDNLFLTWCTILIVVWYRTIEKDSSLKVIIAAVAIIVCFAINFGVSDRLKADSRIGQSISDFVTANNLGTADETDFILYDSEAKGVYPICLFYGKVGVNAYQTNVDLIYSNGTITFKNN